MMSQILLQTSGASPQWWLVGWMVSIGFLLLGYAITVYYYNDEDLETVTEPSQRGGESA